MPLVYTKLEFVDADDLLATGVEAFELDDDGSKFTLLFDPDKGPEAEGVVKSLIFQY
jgi:hypothetical protein